MAGEARARYAVGMADGDGAAVDVEPVVRNAERIARSRSPAPRTPRSFPTGRCRRPSCPCARAACGTANTGPMPISSGSQPATANAAEDAERLRARAARPRVSLMTTHAEAPSENWLALPAATTPPGSAGLIFATPSYVVSARMPFVGGDRHLLRDRCATVSLSATPIVTVIGTISASNLPAACAAAARCWLCTPYSSWRSREMS